MRYIKEQIEQYKDRQSKKKLNDIIAISKEKFQIREYNGEVYLTVDGQLICPMSMLRNDEVSVLSDIRDLFIDRKCAGIER